MQIGTLYNIKIRLCVAYNLLLKFLVMKKMGQVCATN